RVVCLSSMWVHIYDRISLSVAIYIYVIQHSRGVTTNPSPQPRCIISRTMTRKVTLFIAFLASETIPFSREAAEAGLAIRKVLLTIHPAGGIVDDEIGAAEMIA